MIERYGGARVLARVPWLADPARAAGYLDELVELARG
jgi:hypothetical protein